jgi:3-dehydroquinate dehydratase-1
VDIELETPKSQMDKIIDLAKKNKCKVILSYHNFEETPGLRDLYKIADACYDKGADIAKIATMVKSPEDNGRLMALYSIGRPVVSLGMGEIGKISRITSLMLGAEFTFASQDDGAKTAPGQIEYSKLKTLFEHIRTTIEEK